MSTPEIKIKPQTKWTPQHDLTRAISRINDAIRQTEGGRIGGTPLWSALHSAKDHVTRALDHLNTAA